MSDDIAERLRKRAYRIAAKDFNGDGAKLAMEAADEITRLRAELAHERRIWIKAMDSVLTKEQSYLFRDICAAAAALKETGDE